MFDEIQEALIAGKKADVEVLVDRALSAGTAAGEILNRGLIPGMERLGNLFKNNEVFIPEVLVAARAMNAGLAKLEPHLVKDKVQPKGVVVIGTAKGDLHDIGKNLVGILLKGAGFEVIDLGHDVAPERFIEAAEREGAAVIGMSALLTTTMVNMRRTIELLEARGLRERFRVIIGGAPVSREFAHEIGADAYAYDAANAVDRLKELTAERAR